MAPACAWKEEGLNYTRSPSLARDVVNYRVAKKPLRLITLRRHEESRSIFVSGINSKAI